MASSAPPQAAVAPPGPEPEPSDAADSSRAGPSVRSSPAQKGHAAAESFAHMAFSSRGSKVVLAADASLGDSLLAPLALPRPTDLTASGTGSSDDDSELGPSTVSMASTTETGSSTGCTSPDASLPSAITPACPTPVEPVADHARVTLVKSNSTSSLKFSASANPPVSSTPPGLHSRGPARKPTPPASSLRRRQAALLSGRDSDDELTDTNMGEDFTVAASSASAADAGSDTQSDKSRASAQQPDPDDPLAFSVDYYLERQAAGNYLVYPSDWRTVLWAFGFMPGLVVLHYLLPEYSYWFLPFSLYFSLAAAVIAHNHNHSPTFTSWGLNAFFGNWVSIFYGYPTYAWIPTHNLNHHRFVNRVGDSTITWRHTNEHNAAVASTYFFVSSYYQSEPISEYVARAKARRTTDFKYYYIVLQYVWFVAVHFAILAVFVWGHGPLSGLKQYCLASVVPALFSLWAIMFVNYIQHVHCDAWHPYNHSRNFVSDSLNFLLFNNGYHTAHHNNASLHWSLLPDLHHKIAPRVHPVLMVRSFWYFVVDSYVLALVSSRFGTNQIGRVPSSPPPELLAAIAEARAKSATSAICKEALDAATSRGKGIEIDGVKYDPAFAQKLMKEIMEAAPGDQTKASKAALGAADAAAAVKCEKSA